MRKFLIFIFSISVLVSCKNNEQDDQKESVPQTTDDFKPSEKEKGHPVNSDTATVSEAPKKEKTPSNKVFSGILIKEDHPEDTACNCYCLEIQPAANTKLCIKENELFINALSKREGNDILLFYQQKIVESNNDEIPWNQFDKDTPIAILSPSGNNIYKLDWKGFSINGELAVDYAILGKKTLEGTYKLK
ncbi:hypothetical protein [Christiangramia aquimixticola]|uniref:hypothetical protein n=1 Tax=Christiangramia aquimixticola TaxID=1697558 RepID=UPI003AA7D50A